MSEIIVRLVKHDTKEVLPTINADMRRWTAFNVMVSATIRNILIIFVKQTDKFTFSADNFFLLQILNI